MAQQAIVASTQSETMTETLAPLVWLWAIPLYIAGGFLGLLQFKLVFSGLTNAAAWRSKLWVWQRVRPSMTLLCTLPSLLAFLRTALSLPKAPETEAWRFSGPRRPQDPCSSNGGNVWVSIAEPSLLSALLEGSRLVSATKLS